MSGYEKTLIDNAVAAAQKAVQYDELNQPEASAYYYDAAAKFLDEAAPLLDDASKSAALQEKSNEYKQRAQDLRSTIVHETQLIEQNENRKRVKQCYFLLQEAMDEDESGSWSQAIELYAQAVEYISQYPELLKGELRDLVMKALDRAEELKGIKKAESPPSPPKSVSKVTPGPSKSVINQKPSKECNKPSLHRGSSAHLQVSGIDTYTEEEKKVLLHTSNINHRNYVPFMDVDLKERFLYTIPFTDKDGYLELAPKQKREFFKFARPEEITADPCIVHGAFPNYLHIKQTVISDCSFVASLAVSANYERRFGKKLVTAIIYPQSKDRRPVYNPFGKYMIRLHINGVARKVIIDDYLPIDRYGRLLCSYSSNKQEFWVSLLEKAYMKVMGGYDFPGSNSSIDLHTLTGWIPERIAIRRNDADFNKDALFNILESRMEKGDVLVTIATGELPELQADRTGLVPTHAYAVMDVKCVSGVKLLKLKNPWSHLRWKGNYSELDTRHWTPELQAELNYDPNSAAQYDNGVFWIDFDSLCAFFDVFYMNWNPELFKYTYCIHQSWSAGQGPAKDLYTVAENPQFRLEINSEASGTVWILLTRHITDIDDFRENKEYITVFIYKNGRKVYYPYDPPPYIDGVKINSPHYLCKIILNPTSARKYTVVVSQYEKSNTIYYTLRAYATCPFTLTKIIDPYKHETSITGEWKGLSAGGCPNHSLTYSNNPKFKLTIEGGDNNQLLIELKGPKQYQLGIEAIIVQVEDESITAPFRSKSSGAYRSGYVILELNDVPAGILKLIPSTFLPQQEGPFIFHVKSTSPIRLYGKGRQLLFFEWTILLLTLSLVTVIVSSHDQQNNSSTTNDNTKYDKTGLHTFPIGNAVADDQNSMTQQQHHHHQQEQKQMQKPQKESYDLNIATMLKQNDDEIISNYTNANNKTLINNNNRNETIIMINESIQQRKKNETNQLLIIHNVNGLNETLADVKKLNKKLQEEDYHKLFQEAVEFGLKSAQELKNVKEPLWYQMGLYLDDNHPAVKVAKFGGRYNDKSSNIERFGFAAEEAFKKFTQSLPEELSRQGAEFIEHFQSKQLEDECPLRRPTRCTPASLRYRTSDGTCNNLRKPWRGAAMLPYQRFLPPSYDDGIQSVRRSVFGNRLPSARDISVRLHRDRDVEIQSVTLMFTQWGQFLDHDMTSTVKSRSFNGSIPRCCERGGVDVLPPDITHPNCLPITVSEDDWFLDRFRIRCIEFTRSAPSTRIDCDLGWREQINQVTPFIDASTIYGSDVETSDSTRTFRNGKLIYGRDPNGPLQPPDPPGGELCRSGALTSDCFQAGDGRVDEQPGLTALHTIFIRYHNKIATALSKLNRHWSDEKVFQETRKIVYSVVQHITYREYLPLLLGKEVIDLFELDLKRKAYYTEYDPKVNPAIANSFSAAAFRFGHSMVQNSYVRFDSFHRPLFNNVSLHEELDNLENIWSFGSIDRIILGFCNQASQRRDEFIADELTNHLFQSGGAPFGMDLAAINIQRGRDHGLPPYTNWRKPCGLSPLNNWSDLERIMSFESVQRLKSLYDHVDDIDLYSGGLAEKPVRGGIVGPTFACIIAQQFLNLRKGDRFWYENGDFESSFTPAQLQQIRKVSLAQILCDTLPEIRTIQPFVFLSSDNFRNVRTSCEEFKMDFLAWGERHQDQDDNDVDSKLEFRQARKVKKNVKTTTTKRPSTTKRKITTKPKKKPPLKIPIMNITTTTVRLENKYGTNSLNSNYGRPIYYQYDNIRDMTYLVGTVPDRTTSYYQSSSITQQEQQQQKPIEVNIKIQYFLPTTTRMTTTTKKPKRKKRPTFGTTYRPSYDNNVVLVTSKPHIVTARPITQTYHDNYPIFLSNNNPYEKTTTKKPYYIFSSNSYNYDRPDFNRPVYDSTTQRPYFQDIYQSNKYPTKRPTNFYNRGDEDVHDNIYTDSFNSIPKRPSFGTSTTMTTTKKPIKIYAISHIEKLDNIEDKLDFKTRFIYKNNDADHEKRYVKISSVKAGAFVNYPESKEGALDLGYEYGSSRHLPNGNERIKVVDIEVSPSEIRKDQWIVYNVTEGDEMPQFVAPDINFNISCTNELPQPINISRRNDF